ncbi:MAG TPA: YolD-like family protein [Candidatus Jeotgalibaca merdavium]|uniref:YolD-like family protein n=1 Tax=Candidatus Jeotgalibaca merdavium TaxID=2838627 RepID=A0A9D2I0X8_9LACT|nr:YolD-like family protein [Candidatus Jeotgalibaca merdavium]
MNVSKLADINIPQGRGMIKWAPFATMPEQYENVRKLHENNTHVPAPDLSTDLQQELELKLRELEEKNVILRYWQAGHEFIIECTIVNVDDWSESVTVIKDSNLITVEFKHVYSVDEYSYMSKLD